MSHSDFLMQYLLMVHLSIGVVAALVTMALARKLPAGLGAGLVGAPLAILLSWIIAGLGVIGWLTAWDGVRVLRAISSDIVGALSYYSQMAIEFGLIGIAIGLIAYIVARWRDRKKAV